MSLMKARIDSIIAQHGKTVSVQRIENGNYDNPTVVDNIDCVIDNVAPNSGQMSFTEHATVPQVENSLFTSYDNIGKIKKRDIVVTPACKYQVIEVINVNEMDAYLYCPLEIYN